MMLWIRRGGEVFSNPAALGKIITTADPIPSLECLGLGTALDIAVSVPVIRVPQPAKARTFSVLVLYSHYIW
jgi:hypothetical protein